MDTRWLTYDELAAVLRITAGSARRLVGRNKHWSRKPGNDGRVRIGVPVERRVVAEVEAAVAPALRVTVEALKCALGTEQGRVGELRAERDRLARWSWWPFRRAG